MTGPKKVDKELYQILYQRMIDQGWDNIRRFTAGSKVPFSIETKRRLFNECDYKSVAPITIAIVARYLDFTNEEIRELLQKYTTDRDVWPLIGDSDERLTNEERAWLELFSSISKNSKLKENIFDQIEMLADLSGEDVSEQLKILRRLM